MNSRYRILFNASFKIKLFEEWFIKEMSLNKQIGEFYLNGFLAVGESLDII